MDNATDVVVETPTQKPGDGTPEPTVQELQEKLAKSEQTNSQLYARLKKDDKSTVEPPEVVPPSTKEVDPSFRDELRLVAQGLSEEDISVLKRVQTGLGNGVSLADAMKDPLFTGYKANKLAEKRKEAAQMPASNMVAGVKTEKPIKTMTRDEHKALANANRTR